MEEAAERSFQSLFNSNYPDNYSPACFEGHHHAHVLPKNLVAILRTKSLELDQAAGKARRPLGDQEAQLVLPRLVQVGTEGDHPDDLADETCVHVVHFTLLPIVTSPHVPLNCGKLFFAKQCRL